MAASTYHGNIGTSLAVLEPNLRACATRIWCEILGVQSAWVFAHMDYCPTRKQSCMFTQALQRLQKGEPLAYILGKADFYGLEISVNANVLIPRPETEIVVEQLLELELDFGAKVVDLGTGSGAIACALAVHRPHWHVYAVDNSVPALLLAAHNFAALGVAKNTFCVASYWMDGIDFVPDAIISNPPYIAYDDIHVHPMVQKWEPHSALFAHNQGFAAYQYIFHYVSKIPPLWLLIEHGASQQATLVGMAVRYGFCVHKTFSDYAGHQRAMLLRT